MLAVRRNTDDEVVHLEIRHYLHVPDRQSRESNRVKVQADDGWTNEGLRWGEGQRRTCSPRGVMQAIRKSTKKCTTVSSHLKDLKEVGRHGNGKRVISVPIN